MTQKHAPPRIPLDATYFESEERPTKDIQWPEAVMVMFVALIIAVITGAVLAFALLVTGALMGVTTIF